MFTDMVGYTALGQRNESLSIALVEEQRRLVRPVLSKHGGREVKTMGDAFLVEFPNATDAARCAYDIQRTIREFNPSLAPEKRIHLRIGIHLGEVVESQEDISGDAVNVASRIEPLAEDGGICLSRQVYDQVQNKLDIALTSIGTKQLKNVSAPLEVFKMAMPWIGEQGVTVTQSRQRIAVLPFANMSPDPADEYFADGLTEELITKLSEIEGLRVIARTSVMNYKKREKSVLEIGRELAVGSVIEGSIRKSGNKVRITAQLINTQNEEHQWASTYDRELDDIFAIQSDVASKVASSLKAGILTGVERRETDDLRAYMFYLRASQLIHESTEQSLREAISLLEQAVSEDAAFARAHAGLASAWGRMVTGGYEDFTKGVARAEENARRALETGPELAESHAVMAMVHSFLDRYDQLRIEAEKATEINPNLVEAHIVLGINHITFGRLNKGIESFRKAYELDPLRFPAANHLALSLWEARKTGDALEILGKMRELYPRNPRVYASLAECYMSKREFDKAQDMLDFGKKINPDETYVHLDQGILYALTGRKKEALGEIDYLNETKTEGVWLFGRLFIQTALGNLDEAFKALKRQVEIHSFPFNIGVHPIFKDLRKDSRYIEFCERTGIPTRARSG